MTIRVVPLNVSQTHGGTNMQTSTPIATIGSKATTTNKYDGERNILTHYAAVCNNLGAFLIQRNELVSAMQYLQESVQTLMNLESSSATSQSGNGISSASTSPVPSEEKITAIVEQLEQQHLLFLSLSGLVQDQGQGLGEDQVLGKVEEQEDEQEKQERLQVKLMWNEKYSGQELAEGNVKGKQNPGLAIEGIPGLFGMSSSMIGSERNTEDPMLAFSEPFMVAGLHLDVKNHNQKRQNTTSFEMPKSKITKRVKGEGNTISCENTHFHKGNENSGEQADINDPNGKIQKKNKVNFGFFFEVAIDECSKASLFNMGLIHYKWKSMESAVQFFELSMSLAQPRARLTFDPVILACSNNIGQIYLQRNKTNEAKGWFQDALARGNSALVQITADFKPTKIGSNTKDDQKVLPKLQPRNASIIIPAASSNVASSSPISAPIRTNASKKYNFKDRTATMIHRFIARTLMNTGWWHFLNCEYDSSLRVCSDAIQILGPKIDDVDSAALYFNIAIIHHHQNERMKAIYYTDKFLNIAYKLLGINHLQIAQALHRKSLILFEMGNLYESSKLLHIALRIRKAKLGNGHPLVAEHLVLLGKVYQEREELDYATSALQYALRIQRDLSHISDDVQPQQQLQHQQQQVQQSISNNGNNVSFDVAQTLIDLGRALLSQGKLQESLDAYLEVARLTKQFFGERHIYVARILKIIGNIYLEQEKINEAMESFTEGMRIHVQAQNNSSIAPYTANNITADFLSVVQNPLCWVNNRRNDNPSNHKSNATHYTFCATCA